MFMIFCDDWGMAKRYRPVDRDQAFLFPPDMRDWLSAEHPVHLVIRVVEQHLDTSALHALRRTGGAGTAGYDPDMLVTVLIWAYAHQVTSSRRIEQLCHTDVAFRLICAGNLPDHVTFARFRAAFPGPVGSLFAQVLALCAALGMGRLGVVALDGTKIAAPASKSANRTEDKLRKMAAETVARHGETDAAEDELFGQGRRGDEVPEDVWSPRDRDGRISAALAGLERQRAAAGAGHRETCEEFLAGAAAGTPRMGPPPAGTEVELARMQVERATAAQQAKIDDWDERNAQSLARAGRGLRNPPRRPASQHVRVREAQARLQRAIARQAAAAARAAEKEKSRKGPGPVRNITDPDSRLMPVRGGGFIQGYNAQNVASEDGLIIATCLTQDTGDTTWLKPMTQAAEAAAALITARQPPATAGSDKPGSDEASGDAWRRTGYRPDGAGGYDGPIGLLLADAGYCSEDNITTAGPPRLIATGKLRDLERKARAQDGPDGTASPATTAMAGLLQTEDGITAYRHRGHISETPHGDIKHNKRFRQLSVRGLAKASAEWQFTATTANLFKAISTGHLTSQALDNLAAQAR